MKPIARRVGKEFTLMPAGCLHWPIGEKDLLQRWVEDMRTTPNALGILMGDSMDVARTHYRTFIRSYQDDENSQEAFDAYVSEEVGKLAEILEPISKQILGVVIGNHYWDYCNGTNTEQDLCRRLKVPYLGPMGLIQLRCTVKNGKTTRDSVRNLNIFAHHTGGLTSAMTIGGDANSVAKNETKWDADIYLTGHTHRRFAFKESVMTLSNSQTPKVIERTKIFVRTGAFLKSFKETNINSHQRYQAPYAESRAYRATDLGWVKIHVRWREHHDMSYPEYTVEY